jgi:lycopene cyclase CruP
VNTGVLTREEAEQCISIEFNPIRAGFDGSEDIWVRDVLNLGFSPVTAVELVRL